MCKYRCNVWDDYNARFPKPEEPEPEPIPKPRQRKLKKKRSTIGTDAMRTRMDYLGNTVTYWDIVAELRSSAGAVALVVNFRNRVRYQIKQHGQSTEMAISHAIAVTLFTETIAGPHAHLTPESMTAIREACRSLSEDEARPVAMDHAIRRLGEAVKKSINPKWHKHRK